MAKTVDLCMAKKLIWSLLSEIDQKLRKGMPANAEILNYKKDGTPFWNELVIQPIVDEKGEYLIHCIIHS